MGRSLVTGAGRSLGGGPVDSSTADSLTGIDTTESIMASSAADLGDIYDYFYYPAIGLLFLVGVTGNLTVIVQSVRDKQLHTPTFAIIASVAVADLLFLGVRIPLELLSSYIWDAWALGDVGCRIYMYLLQVVAYSEAYHLVLLAIVRYYQLTHPLDALHRLTTTKTVCLSASLWLFLLVVLSPVLAFTGVQRFYRGPADTEGRAFCFLLTSDLLQVEVYFLCYSFFCYLLPLFVLIAFHVGKAVHIRRATMQGKKNRRRLRVMSVAVVCILVLFGVLLAPVHVMNILLVTQTAKVNPYADVVFKLLAYLNSVVNPLIYAFCAQKVRQSCLRCMPCCRAACFGRRPRGTHADGAGKSSDRSDMNTNTSSTYRTNVVEM